MWEYMEKWLMKCGRRTWNELFFMIEWAACVMK